MAIKFGMKAAVQAINNQGALLVYPIDNHQQPRALWHEFHPRTKMKWEWNDKGDDRVADLWILREQLSRSGQVIYSKWYKNRATFFSKDVFAALLRLMQIEPTINEHLQAQAVRDGFAIRSAAATMLEALEMDSPLSTKQLKVVADLKGKANERIFTRATQDLWLQFLIVGYGEIADGAFPSLAVGATQNLFEQVFKGAMELSKEEAVKVLDAKLPRGNLMREYFEKVRIREFLFHQKKYRAPTA
jgi:hypothetical protein